MFEETEEEDEEDFTRGIPLGEVSLKGNSFLAVAVGVVVVGLEGTGIFEDFVVVEGSLRGGPRSMEGDALEGQWEAEESSRPRAPFLG